MPRLRLAVIGVGHLGKEHARILAGIPEVELVGVVDVHAEQAQAIARRYGANAFTDYWPLLNLVDAAVIAVPTVHHHLIAREFLCRGIPLMVEKPLAATAAEASELVDIARAQNVLLQVGHIERFNPAFEELQRRPLRPRFVVGERLGPFTGRSQDIGAVLDLMIHDLDLLLTLVQGPVNDVAALGVALTGKHEDMVNARLTFANGCVADLNASRLNPAPQRQMRLWGPEGFAAIDFARRRLTLIQPSDQVRKEGLNLRKMDPAALALLPKELFNRYFEVIHLDCNQGDQLTRELQEFATCVRTGSRPRVSGQEGLAAILLAERVLDSIRNHAWNGVPEGAIGGNQVPEPEGKLFQGDANLGEAAA